MGVLKKIVGPLSKYDNSLPYTYLAKTRVIEDDDTIINHYFADTICGLIEYLEKQKINPAEAELFGCYKEKEIALDKDPLLTEEGAWLKRPKLCKALEDFYRQSLDERYKGHEAHSDCSFDDREREGNGPF